LRTRESLGLNGEQRRAENTVENRKNSGGMSGVKKGGAWEKKTKSEDRKGKPKGWGEGEKVRGSLVISMGKKSGKQGEEDFQRKSAPVSTKINIGGLRKRGARRGPTGSQVLKREKLDLRGRKGLGQRQFEEIWGQETG